MVQTLVQTTTAPGFNVTLPVSIRNVTLPVSIRNITLPASTVVQISSAPGVTTTERYTTTALGFNVTLPVSYRNITLPASTQNVTLPASTREITLPASTVITTAPASTQTVTTTIVIPASTITTYTTPTCSNQGFEYAQFYDYQEYNSYSYEDMVAREQQPLGIGNLISTGTTAWLGGFHYYDYGEDVATFYNKTQVASYMSLSHSERSSKP